MNDPQALSPQNPTLNEAAQKAIKRAWIAGFVMSGIYLVIGVFLSTQRGDNGIIAFFVIGIALLFFFGSILAVNDNTSGARVCWLIGGIAGLPLGLVMVGFANMMKAAITKSEAEAANAVATTPAPPPLVEVGK